MATATPSTAELSQRGGGRAPHLLQCANVGSVVGGTGACAWTVTRALPTLRHTLGFFGAISAETRELRGSTELQSLGRLDAPLVRRFGADLILLHNTPAHRVLEPLPAATLLYLHSYQTSPAPADVQIYCSRWLADRYGADPRFVCHQGVPLPPRPKRRRKRDGRKLVVGRLCTPSSRKWPNWLPDFYRDLSRAVPAVRWEFVGCPESLQPTLMRACQRRARFHEASWSARSHLWNWDVLCYSNPDLPESFGRVCAEAMRTGCVPVVDNQGGFREQVEDGRSGFLCSKAQQFAEALQRLTDPVVRSPISSNASLHANEQFSVEFFATRLRKWMEVAARVMD